ncbi:hypothetical protein E2C01_017097 [Portunus trituberculatus]|uniref:Uncharacterized protein n=1 Tax=Portunus trituberculatus TaxID=210409 RepID=A0A5B7DRJ0_PORTR|nr:hypothetical protein [Portunus trituberculatus]
MVFIELLPDSTLAQWQVKPFGMAGKEIFERRDRKSLSLLIAEAKKKDVIKEKKLRKIHEDQEKRKAEGETYIPGGAGLD